MNLIGNIPEKGDRKRLVIVGGGFAGLELARKADRKYYQVVMIDKENYYQFQPLFYQVATAGLEASSISYPHRKSFQNKQGLHFRMAQATEIVTDEKLLKTDIGDIHYDYLAIATGCGTNYFGNEDLRYSTYGLKSVSEAILLRNRILLSFEQALGADSEEELHKMLSFVIVGGGATGVELAGALADMRRKILPKDYPEIDFTKMEIHLVDASPRLLAGMSENASEIAAKTLKKRGVVIHQDVSVKSYDEPTVVLSNGTELISQNVMWVAGIKGNQITGLPDEAYDRSRLLVNEYNQVKGFDDIFGIGDNSLLIADDSPRGHAQVAQVALQMAKNLANNLNRKPKGKEWKAFKYNDKGSMATIGRSAAVVDLGKLKFGGVIAWWMWLFVHIMSIVGMRNRIAVFIDWVWHYFNYDVSLRLFIRPRRSDIYRKE